LYIFQILFVVFVVLSANDILQNATARFKV